MTAATVCRCGAMVVPGEPHSCAHMQARAQREQVRRQARSVRNGYNAAVYRRNRGVALRRDGYECQQCGTDRDLTAHHIVKRDPPDHSVENLRTLCRRCHGALDGGRRYAA